MAKTRPGGLISKPKTGKRDLESYTIRGTTKVVRGNNILKMRFRSYIYLGCCKVLIFVCFVVFLIMGCCRFGVFDNGLL